ncbi:hypothetical protein BDZ97DRAFT_1833596 [Flammula alnicola]|nr:hypothetical protein BDZ97DRAFT_1833596 [Flammula alnicola]
MNGISKALALLHPAALLSMRITQSKELHSDSLISRVLYAATFLSRGCAAGRLTSYWATFAAFNRSFDALDLICGIGRARLTLEVIGYCELGTIDSGSAPE